MKKKKLAGGYVGMSADVDIPDTAVIVVVGVADKTGPKVNVAMNLNWWELAPKPHTAQMVEALQAAIAQTVEAIEKGLPES